MASNNAGIQTLLEAEKEAGKIVQKARQYRTQRLKDARVEAQVELEGLKTAKMAEYKKLESGWEGMAAFALVIDPPVASQTATTAMQKERTEADMATIRDQFEKSKESVIARLLAKVSNFVDIFPVIDRPAQSLREIISSNKRIFLCVW